MKQRQYNNDYLIRKLYKSFLLVSIMGALAATAGMLIDNIIVGQFLGPDALAAMAVVTPISLVFSIFSNICSGGGTVKAAHAIGKGDKKAVGEIFSLTMLVVLVVSVLITLLGLIFAPQIVVLLGGKNEEIADLSVQYLRGYFLGTLPTVMMPPLAALVRVDGSTKLPLYAMITMSVADVVLDLVSTLVFHGGMFGMAVATSVSYVLAVGVLLLHFRKKDRLMRLVPIKNAGVEILSMVKIGTPTALSRAYDTVKLSVLLNLAMAAAGAAAVTAFGVRNQAENIISALAVGVGQALVPIAGIFYGEEDASSLKKVLKSALLAGVGINTVAAVLVFAFPQLFTLMLGVADDAQISALAYNALRCFAAALPFKAVNTVTMNFYQSTKRSMYANLVCLLQSLLYPLVLAVILVNTSGIMGLWLVFPLAEILTLISVLGFVMVKNHHIFRGLSDVMLLKAEFGSTVADSLELSIPNSMAEVMKLSEGIGEFVKDRDIPEEVVGRLSLCIEEMAGNIVQHAYHQGEKRFLDFMLTDQTDRVVLRFRDNGAMFDPPAFLKDFREKAVQSEAGEKREILTEDTPLGIRLVAELADEIDYQYYIGLNNLTVIFEKK